MRVIRVTAALVLSLSATQQLRADDDSGELVQCLNEAGTSATQCIGLGFPPEVCDRMQHDIIEMCHAAFPH